MKRVLAKLGLSVGVFAALAVAVELGLRAAGYRRLPPPPIVVWNPVEDEAIQSGKSVFQVDAACLWSPRPGAVVSAPLGGPRGEDVVNAAGFRGPPLARERTPGRLRIATLGDSSTFGMGVAQEDTYTARLAGLCAARGVEAEVLNGGVVGYTARQGLERYRRDVRPYRPDVVIAAFGAINDGIADHLNDADKLARLADDAGPGTWMTWLRERSRTVQLASSFRKPAPPRKRSARGPSDPPVSRTMPEGMVPRVSLEAFEAALVELDGLVREDGGRLVVVSMPRRRRTESATERPHLVRYSALLAELADEHGWPLVDARGLFRQHPERATLLLDPFHPTPRGHELIAEQLAAVLVDLTLAER